MTRGRTPEEVERLLGEFAVGDPPAAAEARILREASRWRARRRAAFWGAGVAAAAVIGVCLALSTRAPSAPFEAPSVAPPAVSVADLGTLRAELAQIGEMCEVIPPEKQAARQAIDAKLSECLERLAYLERRLGGVRESSLRVVSERAVLNV